MQLAPAIASNPEFTTRPPRGDATLHFGGEDGSPALTVQVAGFGRATAGVGTLGEVIHQAAQMVREDPNSYGQGIYQSQAGAYSILTMGVPALIDGDIMTIEPVSIDPAADAPGYVPTSFSRREGSLQAIVSGGRFASFTGAASDGQMQTIVNGAPGVAFPPIPAR